MARKEASLTEAVATMAMLYYSYLYLVDRKHFWEYLYILIGVLILGFALWVWFLFRDTKKKKEMVEDVERLGMSNDVESFISRSGKEKAKGSWKYMGYGFNTDKMKVFVRTLSEKGLRIKDIEDLKLILIKYIDIREEALIKGGFESKQYKFASLSGEEFEDLLVRLYTSMGYIVEHPGGTGDQGGDLILNKNGQRILVQAKRYSGNIGNAAVQQAVAAKSYYDCNRVMLIGSSNFTRAALELASYNQVELIGKSEIQGLLLSHLGESWD
jgi:HJR/Mrr/RecB family endonuclease